MHVEIRNIRDGEDNLAGVLRLQDGAVAAEPAGPLLQGILDHPAADHARGRLVRASAEPVEFLRALHQQYRSAYLRASEPIDDDEPRGETVQKLHKPIDHDAAAAALAEHYADLWNTMKDHGEELGHEHLHEPSEELSRTDWRVTRRPSGDWVAHRWDDHKPLRAWKGYEPAIMKEAEHAPKGGIFLVNFKGEVKFYVGGQWIPAKEIANLPPDQKAKLQQAQQQAKMQRVRRGDINPERLRSNLKPVVRPLDSGQRQRAANELQALHDYHGALTLHRIEQLAKQQVGFLKRHNLTEKQRDQVRGNLSRLHAMVEMAQASGVTGKVPDELRQQAAVHAAKQAEVPQKKPKQEQYTDEQKRTLAQLKEALAASGKKPEKTELPEQTEEGKTIPASAANHPANPDAEGFLSAHKFAQQQQFKDRRGRADLGKALAALKEIIRRHQEGGGRVQLRTYNGEPFSVTLDESTLRDNHGKAVSLSPLLFDPKGGLKFLPPEKKEGQKQDEEPPARKESPLTPEDAAKALAKQASHIAQPKEGTDAASELNRQLIEESKKQPKAPEEEAQLEPKQSEPPTEEEAAFRAGWNKALQEDPISRRLIEKGKPDAARERVLFKLMQDGLNIPERVQEKYADAYGRAVDRLADTGASLDPLLAALTSVEGRWQRALSRDPEAKALIASKNEKKRTAGLLRLMRQGLTVPEEVQVEYKDAFRAAEKRLSHGQHLSDLRRWRDYETRQWSEQALKEGIPPEHLHQAAREIEREYEEHRERRQKLLSRARKLFAEHGYNAEALTTNLRSGRVEDRVPDLDLVTSELSWEFPEEFGGVIWERGADEYGDKDNALLDYFEQGVPKPMSREEAYEKAFDFLLKQKERHRDEAEENREPGWDDQAEEEPFAFGANVRKSLREWLKKARRAKPVGPILPSMADLFDEDLHPRQPKGDPHGGQFAPKHVQDALERYANRAASAQGGGLFGGEDLQARRGFAKLPNGTPIVFTHGEFEGRTGRIVRDEDPLTGAPRIVAEVYGRPGLVPITPDAIEPIPEGHSWRVEGGGTGAEHRQGALFTADHYLPKR